MKGRKNWSQRDFNQNETVCILEGFLWEGDEIFLAEKGILRLLAIECFSFFKMTSKKTKYYFKAERDWRHRGVGG